MLPRLIEFKGSSFTLLVLYLYHAEPELIRQALRDKIDQLPHFLRNAPVILNVSALNSNINWKKIQTVILETNLHIVGVTGCQDETLKKIILLSGVPLLSEGKENRFQKNNNSRFPLTNLFKSFNSITNKTLVINTLVRSGQQIYAKNTDLIITTSVSSGAELLSDGNIHIYGIMRGRALAGASGDQESQIFCTNLNAELISIAGEYWMMEQIPKEFFGKSARFYLNKGKLTINNLM